MIFPFSLWVSADSLIPNTCSTSHIVSPVKSFSEKYPNYAEHVELIKLVYKKTQLIWTDAPLSGILSIFFKVRIVNGKHSFIFDSVESNTSSKYRWIRNFEFFTTSLLFLDLDKPSQFPSQSPSVSATIAAELAPAATLWSQQRVKAGKKLAILWSDVSPLGTLKVRVPWALSVEYSTWLVLRTVRKQPPVVLAPHLS